MNKVKVSEVCYVNEWRHRAFRDRDEREESAQRLSSPQCQSHTIFYLVRQAQSAICMAALRSVSSGYLTRGEASRFHPTGLIDQRWMEMLLIYMCTYRCSSHIRVILQDRAEVEKQGVWLTEVMEKASDDGTLVGERVARHTFCCCCCCIWRMKWKTKALSVCIFICGCLFNYSNWLKW